MIYWNTDDTDATDFRKYFLCYGLLFFMVSPVATVYPDTIGARFKVPFSWQQIKSK